MTLKPEQIKKAIFKINKNAKLEGRKKQSKNKRVF